MSEEVALDAVSRLFEAAFEMADLVQFVAC